MQNFFYAGPEQNTRDQTRCVSCLEVGNKVFSASEARNTLFSDAI